MRRLDELLRSTSRTFSVGIEALPRDLRDAITLAYLALRVSDYFEDSPTLPRGEKARLLGAWAELLTDARGLTQARGQRAHGGTADAYEPLRAAISLEDRALPDHGAALEGGSILAGLAALPRPYRDPILRHTADTTAGMATWALRGDDFPDEAALDAYMFEVAGRVGLLLTDLFTAYSPAIRRRSDRLRGTAVSFGLGLQTVNVIRGLHEDPARGWTFVPREWLRPATELGPATAGSVDPRELSEPARLRILDFLVRKSGRHMEDAFGYCLALPRRERGIRIFCAIPALLATETARRSRRNLDVFREPVKVGRADVGRIVLKTRLLSFSNGWLARERERARELASDLPGAAPPAPAPPA